MGSHFWIKQCIEVRNDTCWLAAEIFCAILVGAICRNSHLRANFVLSQLLLAVSACERPVTPSSTFSMLPSVTSFLRAADNQLSKEILKHAQEKAASVSEENKEEKMETDSSAAETKKEKDASLCLFEIDDSEVYYLANKFLNFPLRNQDRQYRRLRMQQFPVITTPTRMFFICFNRETQNQN